VRIVRSERVFEGKVWDIRRDTFEYDGSELVREYMDHTGAVAILAIDDDGRALLIKQYRHPIRSRDWELPAGLLDIPGEPPLTAAKRELAEEADLEADDWKVLADIASTPGGSDEIIRIYLARGVRATPHAFAREAEEADIEVRWVPLDDVVASVLARGLHNSPLIIGALTAAASKARGWEGLGDPDAPLERAAKATTVEG
jgi:ADP-ribose pyrophosphatase